MYIEVKIKTKIETADGLKEIAELLMVNAEDVRSAEAKVIEINTGRDIEVCHVKQTKIEDIVGEGEYYYLVKASMASVDEKSGKEKITTGQILVAENDFDHAKNEADKYLSGLMSYVETVEIKKTKISDYYE